MSVRTAQNSDGGYRSLNGICLTEVIVREMRIFIGRYLKCFFFFFLDNISQQTQPSLLGWKSAYHHSLIILCFATQATPASKETSTLMGLCLILHTNKPAATHALPTWRSNAWLMQSSFNFWDHILGLRLFWEGSVNLFCEVYPQNDDILYGEYLPCDETASLVKIADKQSKTLLTRSCKQSLASQWNFFWNH